MLYYSMDRYKFLTEVKDGLYDKHNLKDEYFIKVYHKIAELNSIDWNCKALFCYILSFELRGSPFFATTANIAQKLGLSKEQVKRCFRILKGADLIVVKHKMAKDTKKIVERRIATKEYALDNVLKIEEDTKYTWIEE